MLAFASVLSSQAPSPRCLSVALSVFFPPPSPYPAPSPSPPALALSLCVFVFLSLGSLPLAFVWVDFEVAVPFVVFRVVAYVQGFAALDGASAAGEALASAPAAGPAAGPAVGSAAGNVVCFPFGR